MKNIIAVIILITILSGCATVTKQFITPKDDANFTSNLTLLTNSKKETWAEVSSLYIKPGIIEGKYNLNDNGDIEFIVTKFKFFTNWANGWTEGEYGAFGRLIFTKVEKGFACKIAEKLEIGEIEKGQVRFYDDFYTGEKGMTAVKQKFDRIEAVNDFLRKKGFKPFYKSSWQDKLDNISFKTDSMKLLFPELVYNSVLTKKDVSSDYKIKNPSKEIIIKESIAWNKLYTEKVFPKELVDLRNSGTMYRDFEESLDLFYMDYNLKYFMENVIEKEIFIEVIKK